MIKQKKKIFRPIKGSVLAEAALTIPLLLGITFFIIEFGIVLYVHNSLNQVARSAARIASVTPSYTTQQLIEESRASSLLPDVSRLTLTVDPAGGAQRSVGAIITVTGQYNYTPLLNPFKLLNSNQSWLPIIRSTSVARSEVANAP